MLMLGLSFVACSDGDDDEQQSALVGTWTRQIQWLDTNGTRDHSFTFNADGTGTLKWWDFFEQKYVYQNLKWSANETIITLEMEPLSDGYVSGIRYYTLTSNSLTLYFSDGDLDGTYYK